ncbi:response regulator transcription factor [Nocardioides sp. CCNWLW239]|uniref:response regulator transcription factor n=1 Tax=Nocardioides sp. CCNWLW239 TaxID=3128902 RepID=UPI00301B2768
MTQISVLLVDDHQIVRQGVRAFLSTQPDLLVVGDAGTGEEGVALAAELAPDVVLLDLIMDGMDGVDATRLIKKASPGSQVVILTSYDDDANIFPALRAGALSYVLKDIGSEALADAIRSAARGDAVLHPRVARRVVDELRGGRDRPGQAISALTDRELEVVRLVASGLTNSQLAERLVLSEKTVKGHVSNVLGKLQLNDRTQLAVLAWREGIVRRG